MKREDKIALLLLIGLLFLLFFKRKAAEVVTSVVSYPGLNVDQWGNPLPAAGSTVINYYSSVLPAPVQTGVVSENPCCCGGGGIGGY